MLFYLLCIHLPAAVAFLRAAAGHCSVAQVTEDNCPPTAVTDSGAVQSALSLQSRTLLPLVQQVKTKTLTLIWNLTGTGGKHRHRR